MQRNIDALLMVPFEDGKNMMADPALRQMLGGRFFMPLAEAMTELEAYLGFDVSLSRSKNKPIFGGQPLALAKHRSLTSVVLSTHLERAGLRWYTLDPGMVDLRFWRRRLE